jgi:predicted glycosyltransferase
MRFLFCSHDSMGLGSTRRQLAIATALGRAVPQAKMLLVTSVDEVSRFDWPPNLDTVKVPGLRKLPGGGYFSPRLGIPVSQLQIFRSQLLLETVKWFRPTVVLVDKHPFGIGGELKRALIAAKRSGARIVLGLRDILDDPVAVLKDWSPSHMQRRIAECYDLVLIYGERSVYDPVEQYRFPPNLIERTKYCGYVINPPEFQTWSQDCCVSFLSKADGRPKVIGTTGGGEDGFALLKTFIQAAAGAAWNGFVIVGPQLPVEERDVLQRLAAKNHVGFQVFNPCLSGLISSVDAMVCMGGYNTLAEALSKGIPTVCVPRVRPRSEQLIRALAYERLGLLRMLKPNECSIEALAQKVNEAIKTSRQELLHRANALLNFDGARQAARHILALVRC